MELLTLSDLDADSGEVGGTLSDQFFACFRDWTSPAIGFLARRCGTFLGRRAGPFGDLSSARTAKLRWNQRTNVGDICGGCWTPHAVASTVHNIIGLEDTMQPRQRVIKHGDHAFCECG